MRVDVTLPKGWHEVDGIHLVKLAKLFLKYQAKPDFLVRCFFLFSGWKAVRRKEFVENGILYYWFELEKGKPFFVDVNIYHSLVNELEWISSEINLPKEMPVIKGFNSCNLKLYNVSLDEFLNADNYYSAFVNTNEIKYLDNLIAIFYRSRGETWNSEKLDELSRRFKSTPTAVKYAVFLWFSGVKSFFVQKYPYIFSGNSNSTASVSPEETILNLLSSLNNGDVTNNEKLFKTHVHECFYELNLKIEYSKPNK